MKKRYISLIVGLLIICIVGGSAFVVNYVVTKAHKTNEKYNRDVEKLETNYELFSSLIEDFNGLRSDLAELMEEAKYLEDFATYLQDLIVFYQSYDKTVINIIGTTDKINEACKRTFFEEYLNDKCDYYETAKMQVLEVYELDVREFNEKIDSYNEWLITNKKENEKVEQFMPEAIELEEGEY